MSEMPPELKAEADSIIAQYNFKDEFGYYPSPEELDDYLTEGSSGKSVLFGKGGDWMPYSGPQGGVGWKNVNTNEVVYDEEPPGDVYIPGDYPADVNFDIEIGDISEGDLLLIPGEEGDVDATLAENLGADQSWYGRLENVDEDELWALDIDPDTVSEVTVGDSQEEDEEEDGEDESGGWEEALDEVDPEGTVSDNEPESSENVRMVGGGFSATDLDELPETNIEDIGRESSASDVLGAIKSEGVDLVGFGETRFKPYNEKKAVHNALERGWENGMDSSEAVKVMEALNSRGKFTMQFFEHIGSRRQLSSESVSDVSIADSVSNRSTLSKVMKQFAEQSSMDISVDDQELFVDSFSSWSSSSTSQGARYLWAAAIEEGHSNIPERIADEVDEIEDGEMVDKFREYIEFNREVLREQFGDSIRVYRGVSGNYGRERMEIANEHGEVTTDHRAIASWSIAPLAAKDFSGSDGGVFCREVDVDDVYGSFAAGAGFDHEFEIIASGGVGDYEKADSFDEGDVVVPGHKVSKSDSFEYLWNLLDEADFDER